MLRIENMSVAVDGKEILRDIYLEVKDGETVVLFGENGSGKTTLLNAIMGLGKYKVTKGKIFFKDEDITGLPSNERARMGIGMMFQRPPTIRGVNLRQLVEVIANNGESPEKIAEMLKLEDLMDRDVNLGFSGGELKRSELLQLIAQDPELVLLDEPESGVDLVNVGLIGNVINHLLGKEQKYFERRKAGLMITHTGFVLDYVEADHGCVLVNNTIGCLGNPREILHHIQDVGYEECVRCRM